MSVHEKVKALQGLWCGSYSFAYCLCHDDGN